MDLTDASLLAERVEAGEEATLQEEEEEEGQSEDEEPISAGGGWGIWGALGIDKEKLAKLAADKLAAAKMAAGDALVALKRDVAEFQSAVASDTVTLSEAAEEALPRAAASLQGQLEEVGGSLEGYGQSLITGTSELLSQARRGAPEPETLAAPTEPRLPPRLQMREAVTSELEANTKKKSRAQDGAAHSARVQRFEAQARSACALCAPVNDAFGGGCACVVSLP